MNGYLSAVVFYIFAGITVLSGAMVVLSNRLIYAAFSLLLTFFGVAGLYVFLGADFLAATQVLIYVGGILILLLFGVMLTHRISDFKIPATRIQFVPSVLVVGCTFALLLTVIFRTQWRTVQQAPPEYTAAAIGKLVMTTYLLPFEAVSVLLLVALIGAATLARRDLKPGGESP
ncbi:MAG: NADH-quinone oxidoreductase subunit J [Candidatus Latescibacteria bacterium]|nr:NADH-quinone oxidoreductase subunit J [Candidatus Latescibacterota bacterium]